LAEGSSDVTRQEFIAELEVLMEMDPGTLCVTMPLQELAQWDSMAAIGFIAVADAKLGAAVKPQKLFECRTVEDLLALVGEKLT
jgi:acyl carrier protein